MTNELNLARAFAYEYLKEWLNKYKAENYKQSFMAEYEMVTDVLSMRGALRFVINDKVPTQIEYLAAMLLETVIITECSIETGEAFEVYEAGTMLEMLKGELEERKSALSELELSNAISKIARHAASARAEKDPRRLEKVFVYECWQAWQKEPTQYKNNTAFANAMIKKFEPEDLSETPKHLNSSKVITEWCAAWKKGVEFGKEKAGKLK